MLLKKSAMPPPLLDELFEDVPTFFDMQMFTHEAVLRL